MKPPTKTRRRKKTAARRQRSKKVTLDAHVSRQHERRQERPRRERSRRRLRANAARRHDDTMNDRLDLYNRKRRFDETPEPAGTGREKARQPRAPPGRKPNRASPT